MNLKTITLISALSYIVVIGLSLVSYRLFIVFPQIEQAVIESHQQQIKSIYTIYKNKYRELMLFNLDWAKSDETYNAIKSNNVQFIEKNIKSPSFEDRDIDGVAVIDLNGNVKNAYVKIDGEFKKTLLLADLSPDINIDYLLQADSQYSVIRNGENISFYVSHHIQDTLETKKTVGILLFMKIIKHDFISNVYDVSGLNAILTAYPDSEILSDNYHSDFSQFSIKEIRNSYTFDVNSVDNNKMGNIEILFPTDDIPIALDSITILRIVFLILLPLFVTFIIYKFVLAPIINISQKIQLIKIDKETPPIYQQSSITEIKKFTHSFNTLINDIKMTQDQLIKEANTDGLTGIFNKKYFNDHFDETWRMSLRNNRPISIIMIDIDYFKKYNDHYGHLQGDIALKKVAKALSKISRRAEDTLARYGGEEFVIILQGCNKDQLTSFLKKLVFISTELNIEHKKSKVSNILTISCGACFINNDNNNWKEHTKESALSIADKALYKAKDNGRNQFFIDELDDINK